MQCAIAHIQGDIVCFSEQKSTILAAILDFFQKMKMTCINPGYGSIIMPSIKKIYQDVSEESQLTDGTPAGRPDWWTDWRTDGWRWFQYHPPVSRWGIIVNIVNDNNITSCIYFAWETNCVVLLHSGKPSFQHNVINCSLGCIVMKFAASQSCCTATPI